MLTQPHSSIFCPQEAELTKSTGIYMRSTRNHLQHLMTIRDLAINLHGAGEHHDAAQIEMSLASDFLRYIIQETPEFPDYHAYLLNAFSQTSYQITLLHIQNRHEIEHHLIGIHCHSLVNIANYIYHVKQQLPPARLMLQTSIFSHGTSTSPVIDEINEDRPNPPPGFEPNA